MTAATARHRPPATTASEVDIRLTGHEVLCVDRHESIKFRLSRIEKVMITIAGSLIVGMAVVIFTLFKIKEMLPPGVPHS